MNRRTSLSAVVRLMIFAMCVALSHASQLGKELGEADAKLNVTYQRVLKGLPNDAAREHFKAAQRAWVAWRDAEMALSRAVYEDGKTDVFMQLELTNQRISQLEAIGARKTEYGYEAK